MKNKKGIIPGLVLTTAGLIVLGFIILMFLVGIGLFLNFLKNNIFIILGITTFALGTIYVVGKTRKKMNNFLIVILISSVIVVLHFTGIVEQTMFVLSISNVDVVGDGAKILVYTRQGGGQELQIDFNPSTLNSFLIPKGYQATKSSKLTARYIESNKEFTFITTENNYNSVKLLKDNEITNILGSDLSECQKKGYVNTITTYRTGIFSLGKVHCIQYYNNGYVNSFTGASMGGFKVEFDLDGQKTTLSDSSPYITLPGAKITWVGNLLEINEIGTPSYDIFHVGTSWYLVGKNSYSNVNTGYEAFKSCTGTSTTETKYNSCQATYYNVVNNNINPQDSNYKSNVANIESISFSNGVMFVNLKQPTFILTYTIELDASKVGIIKLTGEPEIVSCISTQSFEEAGTKSVSATIKNGGNTDAYFDFIISCDNQYISGYASSLDFDAQQTKTVNFQLSGGNPGTTTNTGTCSLKVSDRNSGKYDSCNFGVSVKYEPGISDCIGDENKCSGDLNYLFECENEKWKQTLCEDKCEYVANKAQCKLEPGTCVTTPSPCEGAVWQGYPSCFWNTAQCMTPPEVCTWYQESYTIQETDCGIFGWRNMFNNCKTYTTTGCKTSNFIYVSLMLGFMILIVIILILNKQKSYKRRRRK